MRQPYHITDNLPAEKLNPSLGIYKQHDVRPAWARPGEKSNTFWTVVRWIRPSDPFTMCISIFEVCNDMIRPTFAHSPSKHISKHISNHLQHGSYVSQFFGIICTMHNKPLVSDPPDRWAWRKKPGATSWDVLDGWLSDAFWCFLYRACRGWDWDLAGLQGALTVARWIHTEVRGED